MTRDHKLYHAKHRTKRNAQSAAWRLNNLERHREASRDAAAHMRKDEPLRYLLNKARNRAKEQKVPFDITTDDLAMPLVCPLLGLWLSQNIKKSGPHSPTIDRIEPVKGYVRGNVWIISHKANTMKQNATLDQLRTFSTNILRLFPL